MKSKKTRWQRNTGAHLAAIVMITPLILGAQTWNEVGITNVAEPFPNVNLAGESSSLYLSTTKYPDMTATVLHWDGIDWSVLGSPNFASGELNNNEVLTVMNDTPYFLTRDGQGRIIVMYYDGTQWAQLGLPVSTGQGTTGSITHDGGQIYVAFYDQENSGVTVKFFDGTNWITLGVPGISQGSTNYVTLDVHEGIPYVACQENFSLSVLSFDGSNWYYLGAPQMTSQYASSMHIKKDADHLYLSYEDQATGSNLRIMEFIGGVWEFLGESSFPLVPGLHSSLDILDGSPIVEFREFTGELSVMLFQNGTWDYLGTPNIANAVTTHSDLLVSGQTVFVGYRNADQADTLEVRRIDLSNSVSSSSLTKIQVYPNPVIDELWVESDFEVLEMVICDQHGRALLTSHENRINLSSLSRGAYLIKMRLNDHVHVERLIKQ